jgi:hypothetical protein
MSRQSSGTAFADLLFVRTLLFVTVVYRATKAEYRAKETVMRLLMQSLLVTALAAARLLSPCTER